MAGPSREGAIVFDDGFSLESSSLSGDYQKEFEDSAAAELAAMLRFVEDAFYDLPLCARATTLSLSLSETAHTQKHTETHTHTT